MPDSTSSAEPTQTVPTLGDPTDWWTAKSQPQLSVTHAGGQVTVTVSGDATDGFNASVQTRCRVVGDFDARATFQLVEWPGADGIWVSLMAANLGGVNTYRTDSFGETYGTYVPPSGGTSVPAAGFNGDLRLRREGARLTGAYRAGKDWITIFTGKGPTAETAINLSVFNLPEVAPFAGRPAVIRFSGFTLTAKTLHC
jgi:hypothetical protein